MGAGHVEQSGCGQAPTIPGASQSICAHGYVCATEGVPLKGLWSKGMSVLENVHLGASVAVHEDMLEHIRECGYR